jgi:anti-anti-sigma factor
MEQPHMDEPLSIGVEGDVVTPRGELDLSTIDQFLDGIRRFGKRPFVVELAGLTFVDSTGLRCLLEAKDQHPGLRYAGRLSNEVQRVVDLTGTGPELFGVD